MNKILNLSLISLFIGACSEQQPVITPAIPLEPIQNREVKEATYQDNDGTIHNYSLSLPEDHASKGALPVIMYLSDDSTDKASAHYIDNMLAECNAPFPLIIYPREEKKFFYFR